MSFDLHLAPLGSGSRGNAFVIRRGNDSLLIDAGFSRRELCVRMAALGIDPGSIRAVLVTHEHDDHIKGVRVLCDDLAIPMYATGRTVAFLAKQQKLPGKSVEFEAGNSFEIAGFGIAPFSIPHDAVDPVGYVISVGDCRIGIATDLGRVNPLVSMRLADCDALVLESNYDESMLMNSNRPLHLKRRIRGQFGHLNNLDAAQALPELIGQRTRHLVLAHVSRECNTYDTVRSIAAEKLDAMTRADVTCSVVAQDEPLGLLRIMEG